RVRAGALVAARVGRAGLPVVTVQVPDHGAHRGEGRAGGQAAGDVRLVQLVQTAALVHEEVAVVPRDVTGVRGRPLGGAACRDGDRNLVAVGAVVARCRSERAWLDRGVGMEHGEAEV